MLLKRSKQWVAAIAPWFRLCLPSCGPRFESQALHQRFFQFILLKLYRENDENKQKEAGIGPFLKRKEANNVYRRHSDILIKINLFCQVMCNVYRRVQNDIFKPLC